jgi:hypothetical protein
VDLQYPPELVQILIVIEAGDHGTIAKVNEKLAQLRTSAGPGAFGRERIELVTFDDPPINKPHGLNVGLRISTGDVITIFDAEDEPHPDILNVVNTVMVHRCQSRRRRARRRGGWRDGSRSSRPPRGAGGSSATGANHRASSNGTSDRPGATSNADPAAAHGSSSSAASHA